MSTPSSGPQCHCYIGQRSDAEQIDADLRAGVDLDVIHKRTEIRKKSLRAHMQECLGMAPDKLTLVQQAEHPPRAIQVVDKETEAVRLRIQGYSYQDIGDRIGISQQNAYRLVDRAMARSTTERGEQTDRLRAVELARCDELMKSLWARATGSDGSDLVDQDRAAALVLKTMERRARLMRLDRPESGGARDWSDFLSSSRWQMACDLILTALAPFPAALAAVGRALSIINRGQGPGGDDDGGEPMAVAAE